MPRFAPARQAFRAFLAPLLVYGPVSAAALGYGVYRLPAEQVLWYAGGGWLLWTLVEYLLHRFAFHEEPGKPLAQRYDIHWVHHRRPQDPHHVVTSLRLTVPLAVVFFGLFYGVGGGHPGVWPFYGGFGLGYLSYEALHLGMHTWPEPPLRLLRPLWKHHHAHHFQRPDRNYGVTTPLWDYLFRTRCKQRGPEVGP